MTSEVKGPGAWIEGEGEKHPREHQRRRIGPLGVLLWECDGCGLVSPWGPGWRRLGQQAAYDLLGPEGIAVSCGAERCNNLVETWYLLTNDMRQQAVARAGERQQASQRRALDQDTEWALRDYVRKKRGRF